MNTATFRYEHGPLLAAAQYAAWHDREHPDQAGEYPEFWQERITKAREAGVYVQDDLDDKHWQRAWEDRQDQRAEVPVVSTAPALFDPFAEDEPAPRQDITETFFANL